MEYTWSDLDQANIADGHYRRRHSPEFYRATSPHC